MPRWMNFFFFGFGKVERSSAPAAFVRASSGNGRSKKSAFPLASRRRSGPVARFAGAVLEGVLGVPGALDTTGAAAPLVTGATTLAEPDDDEPLLHAVRARVK